MTPIRNVILDFGGVLVEWQPADILARCYADPARRAVARRQIFPHPDWIEMDRGNLVEALACELVRFGV